MGPIFNRNVASGLCPQVLGSTVCQRCAPRYRILGSEYCTAHKVERQGGKLYKTRGLWSEDYNLLATLTGPEV